MRIVAALTAALFLRGLASGAQTTDLDGQIMGSKEDRVLWIFPNYRTVEEEKSMPHIRQRDKLTIALKDSFDPYAFPVAGLFAGLAQVENQYPSWGRGANGYGKRYFGALADQTVSNMMAEAAFPIMLHQDPRYFRIGPREKIPKRVLLSLRQLLVARQDSGKEAFNASNIVGMAMGIAASNLYYPAPSRRGTVMAGRIETSMFGGVTGNLMSEFWPDIRDHMFLFKHKTSIQ